MMKNEDLEIFLPYQKKWLEDKSSLKIIEKNRRCGISWTDAADSVLDAAPSHGWSNTYYMSFNKDNCRQYIEDAGAWAKKLGEAVSEIEVNEEPLLDDEEKSISSCTCSRYGSCFINRMRQEACISNTAACSYYREQNINRD